MRAPGGPRASVMSRVIRQPRGSLYLYVPIILGCGALSIAYCLSTARASRAAASPPPRARFVRARARLGCGAGAVRLAAAWACRCGGASMIDVDKSIMEAKAAMLELTQDLAERSQRWRQSRSATAAEAWEFRSSPKCWSICSLFGSALWPRRRRSRSLR